MRVLRVFRAVLPAETLASVTIDREDGMGEVAGIRVDGQWLEGAADGRVEATAKGY